MTDEKFFEIREKYIKQYPHLANIKYGNWKKAFAQNAMNLKMPKDVTLEEVHELSKMY